MTTDEIHRTLVEARNVIDREGWCRFNGRDWVGRGHCIYNALWKAITASSGAAAADMANECLPALGLGDNGCLYAWNDADGRTEEQVLDVLDSAIAKTAPTPDLSFLRDEVAA